MTTAPIWTPATIPDQRGSTAVVTGGNSGIGLHTARILAEHGATVVLACRDMTKAERAATHITGAVPTANLSLQHLDLASLASVREAADRLRAHHPHIDLLVNNAGVMWTSHGTTHDGFELQLGINHLGHFALTGLLLDRLLDTPGSRIVTVSSFGHHGGRIDFTDLQSTRRYRRAGAYGQSKLANLLFTFELQRRLAAAGAATTALAAHPGVADTDLGRDLPSALRVLDRTLGRLLAQSAAAGALPTVRAATDPGARGGDYFGPAGPLQLRGHPRRVRSSRRSHDTDVQRRLWERSEQLTGVTYPLPATQPA